jgi:uncharacterized membrane protein YeaQ/YmgE (transglycosylase-associated protein family)
VIALKQTLAGGAGGLTRWLLTGGTSRNLFSAIFVGMACGRYLAPALSSLTGISTNSELADAFIVGIVGALLVQFLLNLVAKQLPPPPAPPDDKP